MILSLLLAMSSAYATQAPWTLPKGLKSVYVGSDWSSFSQYSGPNGTADMGSPVRRLGAHLEGSYGIADGVEGTIFAPVAVAWNDDPDQTTKGLGSPGGRIKVRLANEGHGLPVTISTIVGFNTGVFHKCNTAQITNLGEGTTDLNFGFTVGRFAMWNKGSWWFTGGAYYDFRLALDEHDGQKIPADEISGDTELGAYWGNTGLAAIVTGFNRLGGVDVGDWSGIDPDVRWAALDAAQTKVGIKALYRLTDTLTLLGNGYYPVRSQNNPTDEILIGVGISAWIMP